MKHSIENLTPQAMTRKIRCGYGLPFLMILFPLGNAIYMATLHEWVYAATFISISLALFPIALSQYNSEKVICERALRKYEKWYAESISLHEAD